MHLYAPSQKRVVGGGVIFKGNIDENEYFDGSKRHIGLVNVGVVVGYVPGNVIADAVKGHD